jgi:3-deoxy-D-manno-octulosonic-acid transferase
MLLSLFLFPLYLILGLVRYFKDLETIQSLKNRFAIPTKPQFSSPPVWIHAASVGELVSAIPLIQKMKEANSKIDILLTSTTQTSLKIYESRLEKYCTHQFIPFDIPYFVEKFINLWKPSKLILIEAEIWPFILAGVSKKELPIYLINARFSPKSCKRWRSLKSIARKIFKKINIATASSEEMITFLSEMGVQEAKKLPHLKYAADPLPYNSDKNILLREIIGKRPIWAACSLHPGEDELCIRVIKTLQPQIPNLFTILVPRHPSRVPSLEIALKKEGFAYALYSQNNIKSEDQILIVDVIGEMGQVFNLAQVTFVGGSLIEGIGGHNPIEPALYKNALLWGPHVFNFKGICTEITSGIEVKNESELAEKLKFLLNNPDKIEEFGTKAYNYVVSQGQYLDELVGLIQ